MKHLFPAIRVPRFAHASALFCAMGFGIMAAPAQAEGPVVVELFTSQGCSSCPPADALLAELADRDDIIALALHVDYWDYIGWEDTFASPAFTQRQHAYSAAARSNMVYTPQMIIGGQHHVVGNRTMDVADAIAVHRAEPNAVSVQAEQTADGWIVRAVWTGGAPVPEMVVQAVSYVPVQEVAIAYGENAGRSVAYHNIVRSWQVVAPWNGEAPFEAQVMPGGDLQHVIIVQAEGYGPIMGAARLE